MKEYEKPEEMIYEEINKITDKHKLEKEFKKSFPDEDYKEWYELIDEEYHIREKHVQGIGDFVFFSSRGKTQFHEFVLDKFVNQLHNYHISYRRGNVRYGADLFILDKNKNKYPIELETGLSHSASKRDRLKFRIESCKANLVFVLVLNTVDKKKYYNSSLPYLYKDVKIMTLFQFIPYFKLLKM